MLYNLSVWFTTPRRDPGRYRLFARSLTLATVALLIYWGVGVSHARCSTNFGPPISQHCVHEPVVYWCFTLLARIALALFWPRGYPEATGETVLSVQVELRGPRLREAIRESVRHEVWRRDQGRCVDCGSRLNLEFDHIIPWSRGGSNTARTLELRCQACNRKKGPRI